MSVAWFVKRLASMSPLEILHRIREQAKRSGSRRRSYGWTPFSGGDTARVVPGLVQTMRHGVSPQLEGRIRASADSQLSGLFAAHGVAWPRRQPGDVFPSEIWTLDPITGLSWPGSDEYCFDLKYRHRRDLGDIKYVWDFNRLQFLQPLAMAVALWNDEKALGMIETAISSWSRANPPFQGLAWNSGIELSLRAISLVLVANLCGDRLSQRTRDQLTAIMRAHLFWLNRFPSRFSSANNHLIAEALGEFVLASVLPQDPRAAEIAEHARSILEREAALQFLPDGVGAEQSPNYGAFTAEMFLVASVVARAFGRPLAPGVEARLDAFSDFIAWLCDGSGKVPDFGDNDEGRVLTLCDTREYAYPASIARAIAGHHKRATSVPRSHDAAELRDALFSTATLVSKAAPEGLRTFESGGYSILREIRAGQRVRMVLDHGPLGYLAIAAHGHADANAFTLSLDDDDILVDPGTYLYHSGGAWRSWFRGTRAHNTLTVGGVDQSIIAGPFNWSHKAKARLEAHQSGAAWSLTTSHDGYVKRFGVTHRRVLHATAAGLSIGDRLIGAGGRRHDVEASLQFAPGLVLQKQAGLISVRRGDDPVMTIEFSELGEIETIIGGDATAGGWVSPAFGQKIEAFRLVWRGMLADKELKTNLNWSHDPAMISGVIPDGSKARPELGVEENTSL